MNGGGYCFHTSKKKKILHIIFEITCPQPQIRHATSPGTKNNATKSDTLWDIFMRPAVIFIFTSNLNSNAILKMLFIAIFSIFEFYFLAFLEFFLYFKMLFYDS